MLAESAEGARTAPKPHGKISVGELEIAYDIRGEGEPLLLIPGLSMRRIFWPDELCDGLASLGFQVIRMDNRDAGDSSRFKATPPDILKLLGKVLAGVTFEVPYRLEDMADDAFQLMSTLGYERFHVAGASMGGMIAQTMALNPSATKRLTSLTSVMSSPGGRRYSVGKINALRALLSPIPEGREAQLAQMMQTYKLLNGSELPFDEEAARELALQQLDGGTSPAASARQLGAIFESARRRRPRLPQIKTPTLVVHGTQDPLLPLRGAAAMARLIPNAELLVVRGMGHNFPRPIFPLLAGAMATHARKVELQSQR